MLKYIETVLHYWLLFFTLVVFVIYIYIKYISMPDKENITHKCLLIPAIVMNKFFNNIFGYYDGSIKSLITWRAIFTTLFISILANILCISLISINSPENLNIDLQSRQLLISSYFVFLLFNFLGDLISIGFTRHVLYKVSENKMRLSKYIFQDFLGILLGYTITLLPLIILIVLNIANVNLEIINYLKNHGAIGSILIPSFLLMFVFSATSTIPFIFVILAFIAIFSIAIPTFLFILAIVLIHLMSRLDLKFSKITFTDTLMKISKQAIAIIGFILLLSYILKEVWIK